MRNLALLVFGFCLVLGASNASAAPACGGDTDLSTPGVQNNCTCQTGAPSGQGCTAVGDACIAGDASGPTGCISLANGVNVCSTPQGPCSDLQCAQAASDGCAP